MQGIIEQVSVSGGGLPKRAAPGAWAGAAGLSGDRQRNTKIHGGPRKAVLLISAEDVEELAREGFPVEAGSLGENLTVRGIDFRALRAGMRFRAGGALLELTSLRQPCLQLEPYNGGRPGLIQAALKKRHARAGFYAAVVEEGLIRAGDIIAIAGPGF
jgi:MOSC domain-containing protein YiiM